MPSKNLNHPYTLALKAALEAQLSIPVRAVDAGERRRLRARGAAVSLPPPAAR